MRASMSDCGHKCCLCECGEYNARRCARKAGVICARCKEHYARVLDELARDKTRLLEASWTILHRLEALRPRACITCDLKATVRRRHRECRTQVEARR